MQSSQQAPGRRGRNANRLRRYLGPLWLALATLGATGANAETPVDLELALAVDVSRSIDRNEARLQREGYISAFRDPKVIKAIESGMLGKIAVGYFEWAGYGHAEIIVDWMLVDGAASANAFANALARSDPVSASRTSISGAIDFAWPWFDKNGFEGSRRVVDVSGDGPNNWGDLVNEARDRALAAGVTINGLPILDTGTGLFSRFNIGSLDLYYRDCVIGGPGAFLEVAADFNDFARAGRRKLVLEIAGLQPPPMRGVITVQANKGADASPPCDIGEAIMRDRDGF